jgi:hypothetical protein
MTVREIALTLAVNLPLVLLVWLCRSPWLVCALGACWALAVHWINFRVRRVYVF